MKHSAMLGWGIALLTAGAQESTAPPGAEAAENGPTGTATVPVPLIDEPSAQIPAFSEAPLILVHPVAPFTPPAAEQPAPAVDVPVFTALSTLGSRLPAEGRAITFHRVEPPDLVIPPSPPPAPEVDRDSPEFQARLTLWRAIEAKRKFAGLSVTVYDHKVSHIRWVWRDPSVPAVRPAVRLRVVPTDGQAPAPPPGVIEYEAWSNIDWECMRGVLAVEAGGIRYEMMPGIGCVGVDTAGRFGRIFTMPDHPELPASPATFVVTKGDPSNLDATALLRAIHAAYPAQAEELWAAKAARDQYLREHAEWLKAHPPQPKDITIIYGNIVRPVFKNAAGGEP